MSWSSFDCSKPILAFGLGAGDIGSYRGVRSMLRVVCCRQRVAAGATVEDILPEAFAVVREASRRVLGMRHFDVQIIGGIVLHRGCVAQVRSAGILCPRNRTCEIVKCISARL